MHTPAFRLVSLHPHLSLNLLFIRVPEIHDGFEYKLYISRTTIVAEAITTVMEELGLAKSLPMPGAGNLEYVVEEVWSTDSAESASIFSLLVTYLLNLINSQEHQDFPERQFFLML